MAISSFDQVDVVVEGNLSEEKTKVKSFGGPIETTITFRSALPHFADVGRRHIP